MLHKGRVVAMDLRQQPLSTSASVVCMVDSLPPTLQGCLDNSLTVEVLDHFFHRPECGVLHINLPQDVVPASFLQELLLFCLEGRPAEPANQLLETLSSLAT